ncbi:MAG: hypothetical protein KDB16_02735 [Acidimicrobiales bacterium]|nr:hypothetical protein [Acidimicrobiales bacterium]
MSEGHNSTGGGAYLAAAMLAVGDILEPEKTKVEVVSEASGEPFDDDLELEFGDLPEI